MSRVIFSQFVKYLIFSSIAAGVNVGSRIVLSKYIISNFQLEVFLAYLFGMVINFVCNKNFTFPKGPRHYFKEARSFTVVALIGLLLTMVLASLFLVLGEKMFPALAEREMLETVSHTGAVGMVSIYSFLAHKYITYRWGLWRSAKKSINYSR